MTSIETRTTSKGHDLIDSVLANSLKTTINRFREKPLLYFTEADIQSYLHRDLITGNTPQVTIKEGRISLIHREYPTNFRCSGKKLLTGYSDEELAETNLANKSVRSRGHYDLVILNPEFLETILGMHGSIKVSIEHIINKDVDKVIDRHGYPNYKPQEEVLYAVEMKYLHMFNCNHEKMLKEIQKDNEKLSIAQRVTNGFIKPINMVFCSSEAPEYMKEYMTQGKVIHPGSGDVYRIKEGILNIFVESYFDEQDKKQTDRRNGAFTAYCSNPRQWAVDLCRDLNVTLYS
jgi:hypothetical protein